MPEIVVPGTLGTLGSVFFVTGGGWVDGGVVVAGGVVVWGCVEPVPGPFPVELVTECVFFLCDEPVTGFLWWSGFVFPGPGEPACLPIVIVGSVAAPPDPWFPDTVTVTDS
jgi:hypothetical protein